MTINYIYITAGDNSMHEISPQRYQHNAYISNQNNDPESYIYG